MAEPAKGGDRVTVDLETNTDTGEGRFFLNALRAVTLILARHKNEVTFQGKEIARVEFVGDNRAVIAYECPNGYFLFFDKLVGKNNWAVSAKTLDDALSKVPDEETRKALEQALQPKAEEESAS